MLLAVITLTRSELNVLLNTQEALEGWEKQIVMQNPKCLCHLPVAFWVEEYANPSQPIFYMFLSMFYKPIVYIDAWTHGSFIFSFTVEGRKRLGGKEGRKDERGGMEERKEDKNNNDDHNSNNNIPPPVSSTKWVGSCAK